MELYCLEDFKVEFEKLKSKKSYRTIEQEIINYFFDKTLALLRSGTRLNHSDEVPYIKKRLGGRGGFRIYFLLVIKNESLYLMFVHPKTGTQGSENITDESKAYLYKKVLECIESEDLYKLSLDDSKKKIQFD
ncbi:hypothetical protein [Flavivirga sp. 57AJ16]|uniref:hypothetical protein n=1 Tax=Flavivirga sp. 57AJ16 TaxID=3025307 RepID=UPI002365335F|nr:hypothetical protein [Flavivirga sp. 57AJ16]MDD7886332.1 hypothetical protein [Flavivirga sp. 57AJ16]